MRRKTFEARLTNMEVPFDVGRTWLEGRTVRMLDYLVCELKKRDGKTADSEALCT